MVLVPRYTTSIYATVNPSSPAGEIVNMLVSSFKPLYQLLVVTCIFSAMLVPLFVLLLFSSNRETRRRPIFIANVASIMIGLILAGVAIALIVSLRNGTPAHFSNKLLVIRVAQSSAKPKHITIPSL